MLDLPCGCLVIDEARHIIDVNPEALRLLHATREALLGQQLGVVLSPSSRIFFHAQVFPPLALHGRVDELYVTLRCGEEEHPFLMCAARQERPTGVRFALTFLPIHRRARFEQELANARASADHAEQVARQTRVELESIQDRLSFADRLAAVGTLAAGMAHEINNPLTYVLANLESVLDALDHGDGESVRIEARRYAAEALEGSERIQRIVADLRLLSRQEAPPRHRVSLEAVVAASLRLTGAMLRKRATVEQVIEKPALAVWADEGRLIQVLVNLIVNAAQAMASDDAARNRVVITLGETPEGEATIDVSDNGEGIPETIRARIFDPFFTTKPAGTGTGLGLAVCQGIVTALGGRMEVESSVGVGTTFRIRLPKEQPS